MNIYMNRRMKSNTPTAVIAALTQRLDQGLYNFRILVVSPLMSLVVLG